jgi:membrane-associated phospholipid phosphatase
MNRDDAACWASTSASQVAAGLQGSSGSSTVPRGWPWRCFSRAPSFSSSSPARSVPESGRTGLGLRLSHTRVLTAAEAAVLCYLAFDVASSGPVASAEARHCKAPGPAPAWARAASVLAERETLLLTAFAVAAHRWRQGNHVVAPLARLAGGVAVRAVLMRVVRRPRPPLAWWRTEPVGSSFPSRHAAHAALVATMLVDETPSLPRIPRVVVASAYTLAVGTSRVRLGVHWPSDVVGGILTALLWRHLNRNWAVSVRRQHRFCPTDLNSPDFT